MAIWNVRQVAGFKPSFPAIRIKRSLATIVAKPIQGVESVTRVNHHLVVISKDREHATVLGEFNQSFNDTTRIGAAIDVVAQWHNGVANTWLDFAEQTPQCIGVSMDVANRNRAAGWFFFARFVQRAYPGGMKSKRGVAIAYI